MADDDFFNEQELAAFRAVDRVAPVRTAATTPARMAAKEQEPWDEWANEMITQRLMGLAQALGAEVGDIERRLKAELKTVANDLTVLRQENVELRVALSYLRGAADHGRSGGEVLDLPALPRRGLNG
jgi:hypothetical protein